MLVELISRPRVLLPARLSGLSDETVETVNTFRVVAAILEQLDPAIFENYIISATSTVSDMLAVRLLAREAGLYQAGQFSRLNIVPLFETSADLAQAHELLDRCLCLLIYRDHLCRRADLQEVMPGYSDSNKEGGFVAANWALYTAQTRWSLAGCRAASRSNCCAGCGLLHPAPPRTQTNPRSSAGSSSHYQSDYGSSSSSSDGGPW